MVGGDVVGHVVKDEAEAPRGERLPGGGESARTAEPLIDDVVTDAVGRSDDVLRLQIGQRGAVAGLDIRVAERDREPGRAALPHSHQPHGVDRETRQGVPFLGADLAELQRTPSHRARDAGARPRC